MDCASRRIRYRLAMFCLAGLLIVVESSLAAPLFNCTPTPWDEIGPFYRPGAPARMKIGAGYLLSGTVRSAVDCRPVPKARIEVWQAGPDDTYDDAYRATLYSDRQGRYRVETSFPPGYARRPPHIHILVDVKGFEGLVTQHYPKKGTTSATFDLVLVPEQKDGGTARTPVGKKP